MNSQEAEYKGCDKFSREWDYKYDLLIVGKKYEIQGYGNGDQFIMLYNETGVLSWVKSKFFIITTRVTPALKGGSDEESSMEASRNSPGTEK